MSNGDLSDTISTKKWVLTGAGLLLLLLLLFYGAERYLERYLKNKIPEFSNRRYTLSLDNLSVSLWNQGLTATGIQLTPSSSADDSSHIESVQISSINIDDVEIISYLWDGSWNVEGITIDRPEVHLRGRVRRRDSTEKIPTGESSWRNIPPIHVDYFHIKEGNAQLTHPADSTQEAAIDHFELQIDGITTDSTTVAQFPFIRFHSIWAEAEGLQSQTPENYYDISLRRIRVSSSDSLIAVDSLSVKPRYEKYTFSELYGYETDRIDLDIPRIELQRLHLDKLFNKRIEAQKLLVDGTDLEIFHDKRMPSGTRPHRPLPNQALNTLSMGISLDTLSLTNSRIEYAEHRPDVSKAGRVVFGELSATFYNIANYSLPKTDQEPIVMETYTKLMNVSPLTVTATFPVQNTGQHTVKGSLGHMDMKEFNPILEPLAFVSIASGTIDSLKFDMILAPDSAKGTATMAYNDLKIDILNRDKIEQGGDKELISLLANLLKIKSENSRPPLRTSEVSFKRDPQKSIFNYWWKSLLSALEKSIGL